ncbi:MAG: sulfite exporter TauE/SafE family protein, partial [Vicinamibacteraceae bacterium]
MTEMVAALVLGLASSVHCAAMCGPLVMALHASGAGSFRRNALHHAGRLATYVSLGLVAGGLGHLAVVAGFGRGLAVVAGCLLLAVVMGRTGVLGRSHVTARIGV